MLKGAQKRMIVIRTNESKAFEEAYFVIKTNCDCDELDMVAEAERIIQEVMPRKAEAGARSKRKNITSVLCGAVAGLIVGAAAALLIVAML